MTPETLLNIPLGGKAVISSLSQKDALRRRLFDMGLTPGTSILCLLESPSPGIRAYRLRGTTLALRSKDAEKIIVTNIEEV